MNNNLKIIIVCALMFAALFWAFNDGWNRHDRNQCMYWAELQAEGKYLNPSAPMLEQCNHFKINLRTY